MIRRQDPAVEGVSVTFDKIGSHFKLNHKQPPVLTILRSPGLSSPSRILALLNIDIDCLVSITHSLYLKTSIMSLWLEQVIHRSAFFNCQFLVLKPMLNFFDNGYLHVIKHTLIAVRRVIPHVLFLQG